MSEDLWTRARASAAGANRLVHPVSYRADIDGLRAIAVLSVILFHLAPGRFPAGGIGVDIFFVISGYLIGGIILANLEQHRFSYSEFYLRRIRRIRRIFPAFAVMVLTTLSLATIIFFPLELVQAAQAGLAALACAANVYFFETANYFMESANKPLLHTWTLGVEEQFYFLVPPFAALLYRIGGRRAFMPGFLALATVSLLLSEWQVTHAPSAAFYLLPSRAWELVLGVVTARVRLPEKMPAWVKEVAAAAGLLLVLASLSLLDPARRFPGAMAVPPCSGTALLLLAGQDGKSLPGRLLSLAPLRLIGLMSYSLYLWHWPVFVLLLHYAVRVKMTPSLALLALALTGALGLLSWRYVETPFRARGLAPKLLLKASAALAIAITCGAGAIMLFGGFPQRISPRALAIDRMESETQRFASPAARCFVANGDRVATSFDQSACLRVRPDRSNWLLVGDSHAAMLWGALSRAFPHVNIMPAAAYGGELNVRARADGTTINDFWNLIFSHYLPGAQIDGVLLATRWGAIDREGIDALATSLRRRNIALVLIGPVPEYGVPVARLLAEAERRHDPALPQRRLEPRLWAADDALRELAGRQRLLYLSPLRAMCPKGWDCTLADPAGAPLYSDDDHYTTAGSYVLVSRLRALDASEGAPLARALQRVAAHHSR